MTNAASEKLLRTRGLSVDYLGHAQGASGLSEEARGALSQLAQFGQLKTKGNGQTIGAPSTTERSEIHRESAFRWNETKNKTVLRPASRWNETKNKTVLRPSSEN